MGMDVNLGNAPDAAAKFYRDIVKPTVEEFLADPSDKRRGCLASLALSSMAEHFFHARNPDAGNKRGALDSFKKEVRCANWAVGAVMDVANATKHVLRPERSGKWGYEDIDEHKLNTFGVMRFGWPMGGSEILVGPDRAWRLSTLVNEASRFWENRLAPDAG